MKKCCWFFVIHQAVILVGTWFLDRVCKDILPVWVSHKPQARDNNYDTQSGSISLHSLSWNLGAYNYCIKYIIVKRAMVNIWSAPYGQHLECTIILKLQMFQNVIIFSCLFKISLDCTNVLLLNFSLFSAQNVLGVLLFMLPCNILVL